MVETELDLAAGGRDYYSSMAMDNLTDSRKADPGSPEITNAKMSKKWMGFHLLDAS